MATAKKPAEGKHPLLGIYAGMAFLDSHIDRAKDTAKEMEPLMDAKGMLKYYREQLDHVSYCVKDLSGKVWKWIEGRD